MADEGFTIEHPNIEIQFNVFAYINISCYLLYASGCLFVAYKSNFYLDGKAQLNMFINIVGFSVKTITWTYMISIFDPAVATIMGYKEYENKLWDENGALFMWDYFASYAIKMSIFAFIYEMMYIWALISSESPQECMSKHKYIK